jgi:hypothetical protein
MGALKKNWNSPKMRSSLCKRELLQKFAALVRFYSEKTSKPWYFVTNQLSKQVVIYILIIYLMKLSKKVLEIIEKQKSFYFNNLLKIGLERQANTINLLAKNHSFECQ